MQIDDPGFQSTHPKAPASVWRGSSLLLTIVHPLELAGQTIPLVPDLTLGRAPDAGVVCVFHETVSRRHAVVRTGLGGILCLHDLGSRNGTKINGQRPELPTPLAPELVVRLGDVLGVVCERADNHFADDAVLPGASASIARAREQLARAAPDPAPVLIIGETGTGKERLAKEVHRRSGRSGPYLALNCAELSPQLIESELFGHERGAFTGAQLAKPGLFAAAHGGTLFLDEIGELPADLQPKLLRVLQEGEVRPVGSVKAQRVDVRVVAATNRDLPERVSNQQFRRDLYARLALWEIRLPPLRERKQDILPWVELLLALWNVERSQRRELYFSPDAAERILLCPWLDNLRGLNRMLHRLASLGAERAIGVRALLEALPELCSLATAPDSLETASPASVRAHEIAARPSVQSTAPPAARPAQGRPTREELLAVYDASGCSVRATSKHFGKDRRQIYRWLESFGIARE
jgi:transcriptional regulator with GAF, ATPase, and Fis domain